MLGEPPGPGLLRRAGLPGNGTHTGGGLLGSSIFWCLLLPQSPHGSRSCRRWVRWTLVPGALAPEVGGGTLGSMASGTSGCSLSFLLSDQIGLRAAFSPLSPENAGRSDTGNSPSATSCALGSATYHALGVPATWLISVSDQWKEEPCPRALVRVSGSLS